MEKYIALLRGVNVGGKNKISMPELKTAFERHGFCGVSTYINSGNILFESKSGNQDGIRKDCESIIKNMSDMDIRVCIVSAKDLVSALSHAPEWWNNDPDSKHNAIFVISPATVEEVFEQVGEAKPEYEKTAFFGNIIFWSAPVRTFSRTRWSKVVGTSAYDSITIRNANTAIKLMRLAE